MTLPASSPSNPPSASPHPATPHPDYIAAMRYACEVAGAYLCTMHRDTSAHGASHKDADGNAISIVTVADRESQRLIREALATCSTMPGTDAPLLFMGEEDEASRKPQAEDGKDVYYWCVDPIDGTANFTAPGLHLPWGIAIALIHRAADGREQVEAGMIALPASGRLRFAYRDAASGVYRLFRQDTGANAGAGATHYPEAQDVLVPPRAAPISLPTKPPNVFVLTSVMGHRLKQLFPAAEHAYLTAIADAVDQRARLRISGASAPDIVDVIDHITQDNGTACIFAAAGFPWDFAAGIALTLAAGGALAYGDTAHAMAQLDEDYTKLLNIGLDARIVDGKRYAHFGTLAIGAPAAVALVIEAHNQGLAAL